jgi:hypothetical protein
MDIVFGKHKIALLIIVVGIFWCWYDFSSRFTVKASINDTLIFNESIEAIASPNLTENIKISIEEVYQKYQQQEKLTASGDTAAQNIKNVPEDKLVQVLLNDNKLTLKAIVSQQQHENQINYALIELEDMKI